jgi:hypothetical protein
VAGDKEQWASVLQGMRPAEAQAAEWWQGTVLINREYRFWRISLGKSLNKQMSRTIMTV